MKQRSWNRDTHPNKALVIGEIHLLNYYMYIGEIPQNQHTFAFALFDFQQMGYLRIPWWMLRKFIFLSMMFALFFLSSSEMLLNPWGIHAFLFQKTINNQAIAFTLDEFLLLGLKKTSLTAITLRIQLNGSQVVRNHCRFPSRRETPPPFL